MYFYLFYRNIRIHKITNKFYFIGYHNKYLHQYSKIKITIKYLKKFSVMIFLSIIEIITNNMLYLFRVIRILISKIFIILIFFPLIYFYFYHSYLF